MGIGVRRKLMLGEPVLSIFGTRLVIAHAYVGL